MKLLQFLLTLTGRVALSGYESELYREFLVGWRAIKIPGARDQQNARREEVLWVNYDREGDFFDGGIGG